MSDFRAIQIFLIETNIQFKAFPLEEKKSIKAVVPHLSVRTNSEAIKKYLKEFGIDEVTVTQMKRDSVSQTQYIPLFLISMPRTHSTNIDKLFCLEEFMVIFAVVKPYKSEKNILLCHNYQGLFHAPQYCTLPYHLLNELNLMQTENAKI